MSVSYHVILNGPIPEDVVAPDKRSYGQNLRRLSELSALSRELGLTPLEDFVVDFCGLVDAAEKEASEREGAKQPRPAPPPPDDGDDLDDGRNPFIEPFDDETPDEEIFFDESSLIDPGFPEPYLRIMEQVASQLTWFSPGDGLRTMLGLLRALRERPDQEERFYGASWDLEFFACQLAYAEREGLRFHLGVSY